MRHLKNRFLRESVKFIETCQGKVLDGKIDVHTYNLLSDMKIDFLKGFLKTEIKDVHIDSNFSSRIKNLFATNRLIQSKGVMEVLKDGC
jgi:hypothetical protein